jgi:hypothetical protein
MKIMMKPIQIRKEEVVRDIREAAALTNRSITDVVAEGARVVLDRAKRRTTVGAREKAIDRIVAEYRALPKMGRMLTDDDLYDENGFPK